MAYYTVAVDTVQREEEQETNVVFPDSLKAWRKTTKHFSISSLIPELGALVLSGLVALVFGLYAICTNNIGGAIVLIGPFLGSIIGITLLVIAPRLKRE